MTAAKAPVPAGLKDSAKLWRTLTKDYEFRPDEMRILEDACRTMDLIDRMECELKDAQLVVKGSMGQPVSSPLATEIRQHRGTLARLFSALKIPAEDDASARSAAGRALVSVRYSGRGA
jgi:hypothetical protein